MSSSSPSPSYKNEFEWMVDIDSVSDPRRAMRIDLSKSDSWAQAVGLGEVRFRYSSAEEEGWPCNGNDISDPSMSP